MLEVHTVKDASRLLDIPYVTLDMWVRQGRLPVQRLGRYRLVNLADVVTVAAERKAVANGRGAKRKSA